MTQHNTQRTQEQDTEMDRSAYKNDDHKQNSNRGNSNSRSNTETGRDGNRQNQGGTQFGQ